MPKWLKILLLLGGLGILGLGLIVGGIVWWVSANKDQIAADTRASQTEGEAFGRTHAKNDCVDDAFSRLDACGAFGVMCEAQLQMRLGACFQAAEEDGTCKRVPNPREILTSATWANEQCKKRGRHGSQPCGRLMQAVAQTCARQR